MREFRLERVKHGGKTYRGCVLSVDEVSWLAEVVQSPRGIFKSKPLPLGKFAVDSGTKVSRYGATLAVGEMEMVAGSLDEASAILSVLETPKKQALEQAAKSLASAEAGAVDFLKVRAEALAFLEGLRRDRAETMLQLHLAKQAPAATALKGFMESKAEALSGALSRFRSAVADLEQRAGTRVAERVCAAAYLAGIAQNNLFEKGQTGLESEGFLSELGLTAQDLLPPFEDLPARLIAASHRSSASLLV